MSRSIARCLLIPPTSARVVPRQDTKMPPGVPTCLGVGASSPTTLLYVVPGVLAVAGAALRENAVTAKGAGAERRQASAALPVRPVMPTREGGGGGGHGGLWRGHDGRRCEMGEWEIITCCRAR
jgi:hypothetical protein